MIIYFKDSAQRLAHSKHSVDDYAAGGGGDVIGQKPIVARR